MIEKEDEGKEIPLDWNIPFPALWRVDWQCASQLTDSWEMLVQQPDGSYHKYGWLGNSADFGQSDWLRKTNRQRWTTVLGLFLYPCWIDKNGEKDMCSPLKDNIVQFAGTAIFYPLDRVANTPLQAYTFTDIVRMTLGVGPCKYILDLEGQKKSYKGIATCAARTKLNTIYEEKRQKQSRKDVEQALKDVLAFVKHIRGRINEYIEFGHVTIDYLQIQKQEHPEWGEFIDEMIELTKRH